MHLLSSLKTLLRSYLYLSYLLAEAEDVLALFSQDAVHGGVVGHHDVVLHVRLGRREAELDETHLLSCYRAHRYTSLGDKRHKKHKHTRQKTLPSHPCTEYRFESTESLL